MQSTCNPKELAAQQYLACADKLIGQAAELIALARCEDSAGASETCAFIQDLIDGIRVTLRRLGGVE